MNDQSPKTAETGPGVALERRGTVAVIAFDRSEGMNAFDQPTRMHFQDILKEVEAGRTGLEVCREHGISEQTLYRWKKRYGGMEASEAKRLRELEQENQKLKRIVADQAVDLVALKDVLSRTW